jgi:methylphosphotriester-DNA--protein-cysteine methyltransferase
MIQHLEISDSGLRNKIKQKEICFGGNKKLKIYGTLQCMSGKRMKRENRVFFATKKEALQNGYRPCGHCMKAEYLKCRKKLFSTVDETKNLLVKDEQ